MTISEELTEAIETKCQEAFSQGERDAIFTYDHALFQLALLSYRDLEDRRLRSRFHQLTQDFRRCKQAIREAYRACDSLSDLFSSYA